MLAMRPFVVWKGGALETSKLLLAQLRSMELDVFVDPSLRRIIRWGLPRDPDLAVVVDGLGEGEAGDVALLLRERWPKTPQVMVWSGSTEMTCPSPRCTVIPPDPEQLKGAIRRHLHPDAPSLRRPRPRVLCVDDDPEYLKSLTRLVLQHGYEVVAYDDSRKALEALPGIDPRAAIVDVRMPDPDGLAITREIRKSFKSRVPVILLTAAASDDDILQGYKSGARYYLTKPCEPRRILSILDYATGDPQARREAAVPEPAG